MTLEQIFAGWFPGTPKDIVPGDCKFSVKMWKCLNRKIKTTSKLTNSEKLNKNYNCTIWKKHISKAMLGVIKNWCLTLFLTVLLYEKESFICKFYLSHVRKHTMHHCLPIKCQWYLWSPDICMQEWVMHVVPPLILLLNSNSKSLPPTHLRKGVGNEVAGGPNYI